MEDVRNTIFLLEKQYNSFIDQERDWNFFVGLADYVSFLKENSNLESKFRGLVKKREEEYKILDDYEKEAVKEVEKIKTELLKKIKLKKLNFEELSKGLAYLKDCEQGVVDPTYYKSSRIENGIRRIIKYLVKNGHTSLVKEYIPKDFVFQDDYSLDEFDYKLHLSDFCDNLQLRQAKMFELKDKRLTELWGALDKLYLLRRIMFKERGYTDTKRFSELSEELRLISNDGDNYSYVAVASLYAQDQKGEKFSSSNHSEIKEFKKSNYKLYATRIHNYLLKKISEKEEVVLYDLNANYKNGILSFQNKEIDFNDKPNQKDLLATLFKNVKKNWFYDEIQEDWDEIGIDKAKYPKDYWRKFYSAGDDINKAIAIKTQVEDFIIKDATQKGRIRVNPKYI
ncbi:MAG: hypothetical protein NT155_04060 [Candidatus Staskawiczbacteria bacterium]|nr:hypothetical protein [Candidatus Staskawiczbacteria bacterium]